MRTLVCFLLMASVGFAVETDEEVAEKQHLADKQAEWESIHAHKAHEMHCPYPYMQASAAVQTVPSTLPQSTPTVAPPLNNVLAQAPAAPTQPVTSTARPSFRQLIKKLFRR